MESPKLFHLKEIWGVLPDIRSNLATFSKNFQPGLRFKITTIVVLVTALGVLSSTFFTLALQRNHLIKVADDTTNWLSKTIKASLEHAMLTNDWAMVEQILQAEVNSGNMEIVRILDTNGITKVSTKPGEIGSISDFLETTCPSCPQQVMTIGDRTYISPTSNNGNVLVNVSTISNQPRCTSCHSTGEQTLGILIIEKPMSEINTLMTMGTRVIIITSLIVFLLSAGIMVYLLRVTITRPIAEISKGIARIGAGDLNHMIHLDKNDELSRLANAINQMRYQLKISQFEMRQRNRELSVLNKVALATTQTLDLQQILDHALHTIVQSLNLQAGCIYLIDETTGQLVLRAHEGLSEEQCQKIEGFRKKEGGDLSSHVSETNEYILVEDLSEDERFKDLWDIPNGRSYLNIPLKSKRSKVGTMSLVTHSRQPFEEREVEVILAAGHEISLAIDNAQLHKQAHGLAILEERDRLAREIHDKLAQDMGYLNLATADASEMLSAGQVLPTRELLMQLRQVTQQTYTDLREAIFNLRSPFPAESRFLPALKLYLEEYQTYYKIQTNLLCGITPPPEFSAEITLQVIRIIQEALANVRRHADAHQVDIQIENDPAGISICIRDNGRGFNSLQASKASQEHFGLQIMHERAESFGGSLRIETEIGKGTQVWVWIPASKQEIM